jgi:hypothetical protein
MSSRFEVRSIRTKSLEGTFGEFSRAVNYAKELKNEFGDSHVIVDTHLPETAGDDRIVWRQ